MNMLKPIGFILIFLICGSSIAQKLPSNFELVLGPTISRIIGDDLEGVDTKFGLQGGLLVNIPGNRGNIRLGALYNQKGFGVEGIDLTLNYLTLPIHFGYETATGGQFYFGPELNFLINAKASDGSTSVEVEDGINKADISIAGGFIVPLSDRLNMSMGISIGMIKVLETTNYKTSHVGNNLSIPLSLGLRL